MIPGETIIGLDMGGHLWIVLSQPTSDATIVVVSLTSHNKDSCGDHCVIVTPNEHPWPDHDSCVFYRRTDFNPIQPLDVAKARGMLRQSDPLSPALLLRIQEGALASRFTNRLVRDAIRATLGR
ncbi:MAG: hypothetical protein DWI59_04960 [Chloroflexi bacterium]|nr:MAG: hypothetical protein DWI59_04960 [Chloroflexota bacterium]